MYWGTDASRGTRTWTFRRSIDVRDIFRGANISIMRNPLHQDSLDPPSESLLNHTKQTRPVLLEGKVLGIRRVKKGVVTYTITDEISGELTEVNVPVSHTAISPDGGWNIKARPIWEQRGPVLRYPTWVWAHDLQRPRERKRRFIRVGSPTFAPNTE